jgi:hypothetical protein
MEGDPGGGIALDLRDESLDVVLPGEPGVRAGGDLLARSVRPMPNSRMRTSSSGVRCSLNSPDS